MLAEGQIHISHCSKKKIMKICTNAASTTLSPFVFPLRLFLLWHRWLLSKLYDLTGTLHSLSAIKMLDFECFFFRNIQEIFISFCVKEKT